MSGNVTLLALGALALYALTASDVPSKAATGSASGVASGGASGVASGAASGSASGSASGDKAMSDAERWVRLGIETLKTIDALFD
jgi:hypothetical protein